MANAQYFGRLSSGKNQSPFPQVRCLYLAEVGTHAIVDAVFAPCRVAEQRLAAVVLSRSVQAGMLVLMDRGIVSAPRFEYAGPSAAGSRIGAPQGGSVYACRAGAR